MAFDCTSNHRKPLLFSDLFKTHRDTAMEKDHQDVVISSSSSSSTQFLSSWDSSSSGFSTPLQSDLGSSAGDDADFIDELTRKMAECMLEEDEGALADRVDEASCRVMNNVNETNDNFGAVENLRSEFYDPTQPNIQVYESKNLAPVSQEGSNRRRRVRRTESAQPKQVHKTEPQYKQYRGREWGIGLGARNGYSGSGMQAVFLGGSGCKSGSNGTGVFLPRDPTELKGKSGCSMVLMPTRVLQVLEQHFSKIQQDSNAPPLAHSSPKDGAEVELPQEWTY